MGTSIRPDWRFERGAPLVRAQQAAEGETPERAKQVLDLAHETGFTTAFVRDNFDALSERVSRGTFDAERFARESPLVADWLAKDPSRVALMGRDLTGMGFIERQVTNIATRFRVGREQTELFRIGEAVLDGTATPAMRERQRALETRIRSAPEFDMGFFEGAPGAAAQQLPILARTLKAGGVGAAAGAVVGGALGAVVTKSPAGARTGAKFGLTFGGKTAVAYDVAVMEASGAMLDYERIEGMDTETARGAALIAGALAGSLELLSLQQLAKVTPGLRNLSRAGVKNLLTNPSTRTLLMQTARNIGVAAGTEGVTETLQSLITQGGGTIAEAALDGRLQSDLGGVLGEVFGEEARAQALAEGVVGAQAGLVLSTVGGAASFGLDVRAAHRAERQAESIAALADAGAEATVTGEAPREVESLVTELHQSGLKGFSYDVESWQTFWQSVKDEAGTTLDPRDAAVEVMGDALAYDTAVATNGTFEVPLGPWLTRLAKNPAVREWAVSNARVGPGEMSAAEAIKAQESQDAILSELVETMVTAKAESSPVNDIAETLRTRVEREVRNAGRPVREAKRAGELWASVYRTWAEHSGTTADDLLSMFNRVRIGPQAIQQERADIRATLSADPEFDPALTATPEELTARTNAMDREAELAGMAQEAQPGRASARTKTGRLLTSFAGVSTDALVAEWGAMVEKQAIDEGEVAGLETMPEFAEAQEMVGMAEDRRGVVISGEAVSDRAQALATTRGRIAARGQGIQRLAAELAARGIDPTTHQRAIEEATSFDFAQSDIELMDRIAEASATIPEDERDRAARRARADMDRRVAQTGRDIAAGAAIDAEAARLRAEIAAEVDAEEKARLESELTVVLEQSTPGASPRGRIRFSADRTQTHIDLFTKADASTFLHESGHLFLTLLGQLAQGPNATDRIRRDYAGALEWLGAKPGDTLSVAQEEQWARGFEAYLMEGKAPSLTLRNAFATFANWLTRLYREVRNLDVELNPDIRGIFDRMLATDAAIREAQDTQLHEPLFAGAEVMPSAEAARYAEALTAAQERATEQVRTETLAVIAREEKAWFTARRKEIEPEVRAEVLATPAYRARVILQTGKMPDGSDLPTDSPLAARLSKEGVVALIGDIGAKALPKPVMYRVEGGLHPDVVAPLFGFENGLALLTALQGTQSVEREVRQRIEYRLRSEYGDPLTDGSLPAKAMAAIHTAERDRVIQLELEEMQRREPAALRGLLRRFGGRVPLTAAVQGQADAMLSARTIRDIRPIEFQRAEVKAAKQAIAAAAKGDWSAAAEAKIRERLALALYRAATQAREEVATQQDRFARFFRSDELLGKTRDLNLVNAARAVLSRVGIGRAEKSAEDYMKAVRAYDPDTAEQLESLIETAVPARDDMRDLTLAEFREITEQATALWEQSRRTRQMVIDGQKVDRQAVVDELAAELATMPDRMKGAGQTKALGTGDIIRRRLIGFEAAIRRIESWVDQMDGGNISGPFRKYLWTPLSEAAALFRIAKRDLTLQYLALLEPMKPRLASSGPIAAPEIGYTFRDRQELLGAMLHTGNESNFDKLTRGRGWSPEAWSLMVRRLERDGVLAKQDYDFLQAVWRLFEAMKPEAQRVHKDMFGYYFDEITARPFETAFGTYEGGYVPALADTMLAEDAKLRAERAEQEGVNPSTMFPTVSRGFTKGRVDEYARPLVMDLRLIRSHIDAVTRFVHLAQPTRDTGRLATDRRFRAALAAVDPEMGAELTAWAQRAGSQVIETPSRSGGGKAADSIFRWFRSTSGLNLMALNVVNTLQQFTGLTIGAVKVPPKYLRDALWQYVRSPKEITAAINALSPYMEGRVNAAVMEVEQRIDRLVANPDALDNAKAFAKEHGYILQSTTQGVVDSVVWRGAFDHATATGADQKTAIRAADAAVRLTQGSFAPEDVSRFETGSPFTRAFTMFYSYFNMQANLMRSEFAQEMRKSGLRQGAGRLLYVYVLGFMAPAVLSQMIVEGMAGTLGADDDDDGYLDEWMAVFFGAQVRTAFALVPGGNIALTVGFNQFNDKWYDDRVSASPAISTLESAGRGAGAPYFWWRDGEVKRRQIRDVLTLLALVTGLPFVAAARPAQYLFDVQQGDAEPTGPVDFTRGLVSGRP